MNQSTTQTTAFADPSNGLLFEYNGYTCGAPGTINLVSYNIDTYAPRATNSQNCMGLRGSGGSKSPVLAVDSRDQLIFAVVSGSLPTSKDSIVALSETSLLPVATFALPAGAQQQAFGISWYAAQDELIVESDNSGEQLPGVALSAFRVGSAAGAPTLTELWTTTVSTCTFGRQAYFYRNDPYRSVIEPALFIACQVGPPPVFGVQTTTERDGVVKIELRSTDSNGARCAQGADLCPDGNSQLAVVPGHASDFLFDPGSDRAFMPAQTLTGITVLVYDGRLSTFIGRSGVGTAAEPNQGGFALDGQTGRFYAVLPKSSMTVLDGRRTPVSVGSRFPQFATYVNYIALPVLPPDRVYPYPRLLVLPSLGDQTMGNTYSPSFYVYADLLTVTTDAPPSNPDTNTAQGKIPPGASVATTFGGNARGYGVHSDFVGSLGGVTANTLQVTSVALPFGSGNRDVMAGAVPDLGLNNSSRFGRASALADGDGSTGPGYYQCSDPSQAGQCTGLPLPAGVPAGSTPPQAWPYPDAACSHPGTADTATTTGAYMTTSYDANGQAVQKPVPGTESSYAAVTCVDASHADGAQGSGQFSGMGLGLTAFPAVAIASGYSNAWTAPATTAAGVESRVMSVARGLRVDAGGGNFFSIDSVTQTATAQANGLAGGASTTDSVQGVSITSQGTTTELCPQGCSNLQPVVDKINATFPTLVSISQPKADTSYKYDTTHGNGSPGGYTAVVQRDPLEAYGDIQFNNMTPEEASFLPALRIVLYDDGSNQLSREVLDLAGVATDAELGLSLLEASNLQLGCPPALAAAVQPSSLAATGGWSLPMLAAAPATTPTSTSSSSSECATAAASAGLTSYTPGTAGTSGSSGTTGSSAGGGSAGGGGGIAGVYHAIVRFFEGLSWLWRSPAAALQMLAFLLLLGLPLLLMARRRLWLHDQTADPA
jgi:hypothetical protein